jgi:hypothetical protein
MEGLCPVVALEFMGPHYEASYGMLRTLVESVGVQRTIRGEPTSGQDLLISRVFQGSRGV